MLSEKGRNTSLVLMMESCITSAGPQVSHCMSSVVITVTDVIVAGLYVAERDSSTLRRLEANSYNTLVLCTVLFRKILFLVRCT